MAEVDYENYVIPQGDIIPELVNQLPSGPFPYPGTLIFNDKGSILPEIHQGLVSLKGNDFMQFPDGGDEYEDTSASPDLFSTYKELLVTRPGQVTTVTSSYSRYYDIPIFGEGQINLRFFGKTRRNSRPGHTMSKATDFYLTSDYPPTLKDVGTVIAREKAFGCYQGSPPARVQCGPYNTSHKRHRSGLRVMVHHTKVKNLLDPEYTMTTGFSSFYGGSAYYLVPMRKGITGRPQMFEFHLDADDLDPDSIYYFTELKNYDFIREVKGGFFVKIVEEALAAYAVNGTTQESYEVKGLDEFFQYCFKSLVSFEKMGIWYALGEHVQFNWKIYEHSVRIPGDEEWKERRDRRWGRT